MALYQAGDIVRKVGAGANPGQRYRVVFCGWHSAFCRPICEPDPGVMNMGQYIHLKNLERITLDTAT